MNKYNVTFNQVASIAMTLNLATADSVGYAAFCIVMIVALVCANFAERWMADILSDTRRDLAEGFRQLHKQAAKRADDWRDLYQQRKARETRDEPKRINLK